MHEYCTNTTRLYELSVYLIMYKSQDIMHPCERAIIHIINIYKHYTNVGYISMYKSTHIHMKETVLIINIYQYYTNKGYISIIVYITMCKSQCII